MKRSAVAAVAGLTLAGAVGIGVASAATGSGPGDRIADALAGLVTEGTITQKQADAVAEALGKARAEAREERDQRRAERQAEVDALVKDTLGMTRDELREQLRAGKTLKEIAGGKADDLAAGAIALVEQGTKEAVADGRLTQAQADEIVARAKERAKAWLAGEDDGLGLGLLMGGRGMRGGMHGGMGMGPGGFGGPHGPGMWSDADDAADTSASTAST
jgi:hypothetical protein